MKNKKKTFRDKKFKTYPDDTNESVRYCRNYVKNRIPEEVTHLPFSRSSYDDLWLDDWKLRRKIECYIIRFLEKNVGKPISEVWEKFIRMGWESHIHMHEEWERNISYKPLPERWPRRTPFVVEDGILTLHRRRKLS